VALQKLQNMCVWSVVIHKTGYLKERHMQNNVPSKFFSVCAEENGV